MRSGLTDAELASRLNIKPTAMVAPSPMTFHHSHDTDGRATQRTTLTDNPATNPARAPGPVALCVSKPSKKTPRIGPLISDPILLTATSTVDAMSSTKNAVMSANIPQATVSALPHRSSCAGVSIRSPIQGLIKSFRVVADRLLITESSDDMAAASKATTARPTRPTGSSRVSKAGSAILKFGASFTTGSDGRKSGCAPA